MTSNKTTAEQLKESQFKEKVDLLNRNFIQHLEKWYAQCYHADFRAPINSYREHLKKIEKMYGVSRDPLTGDNAPNEANGSVRKIRKAKRRKDRNRSDKLADHERISVSTPVDKVPRMSFGNVSVISSDANTQSVTSTIVLQPLKENNPSNSNKENTVSAPAATVGRKRAIRGGGPLGGTESVVFRGSESLPISDSKLIIPAVNVPKFTPGFWNKENGQTDKPSFTFGKGASDKEVTDNIVDRKKTSSEVSTPAGSSISSKGLTFGSSLFKDIDVKSDSSSSKSMSFPAFGTTNVLKSDATPSMPLFGSTDNKVASKSGSVTNAQLPSIALRTDAPGSNNPISTFGFPSLGSGLGTAPFSFGALPKSSEEKKEGEGDDEREYVPPKAEVIENDEPGATFSTKCSVFKLVDKQYTKLGVGMLYLKETDGKKSLLIRAATTTGSVWLNSLMNNSMKAVKADDKGEKMRIMCPVSATEIGTFLVRFANSETRDRVMKSIEEIN